MITRSGDLPTVVCKVSCVVGSGSSGNGGFRYHIYNNVFLNWFGFFCGILLSFLLKDFLYPIDTRHEKFLQARSASSDGPQLPRRSRCRSILGEGVLSLFFWCQCFRPWNTLSRRNMCVMRILSKTRWNLTQGQPCRHLEDVENRNCILERVRQVEFIDVSFLSVKIKHVSPLFYHAFAP